MVLSITRRTAVWGVAASFGLLLIAATLLPGNSFALPAYAQATGQPCATCHVNPAGGGARTAVGLAFAAIPTHATDPAGAFAQVSAPAAPAAPAPAAPAPAAPAPAAPAPAAPAPAAPAPAAPAPAAPAPAAPAPAGPAPAGPAPAGPAPAGPQLLPGTGDNGFSSELAIFIAMLGVVAIATGASLAAFGARKG